MTATQAPGSTDTMPTAMTGTAVRKPEDGLGKTRRPERARHVRLDVGSRLTAPLTLPRADLWASANQANKSAALEERARIARHLHDSVSQTLYAISLVASRARSDLAQNNGNEVWQVLEDVLQLADAGQLELRALLTDIRSDVLTSAGLTAALVDLTRAVRTRSGLDIRLSFADEPDLPPATKDELLLITREALQNIIKHASASRVDIVFESSGGDMVLLISDDGRGFDPAVSQPDHFGLQSMRERAAAVGGTLYVVSARGAGTHIRVRVPASSAVERVHSRPSRE